MRSGKAVFIVLCFLACVLARNTQVSASKNTIEDLEQNLHALSAVLMDADSGRILFEKNGGEARANASTTKILTCILALEHASGDDYVTVSANAAAQPDVQLHIREGEQYYLEDLLYSLMLKSHNDAAVAIAEHIGGSEIGFAELMNEKAKQLGCKNTYFITPNGLDAVNENGTHHTTAQDLAKIMRYAIRNSAFLRIAQTRNHSFSDLYGKRQFTVQNTNALLDMTEGVLAGKTGYTADAGYCYVCACEKNGKKFIVVLLGCGWPNHKNYKWEDTLALLKYGDEQYEYVTIWKEPRLSKVLVKNAVPDCFLLGMQVYLEGHLPISEDSREKKILIGKHESITSKLTMESVVEAPVKKGDMIGKVEFFLKEELITAHPIVAEKSVEEMDYSWCIKKVFHDYFHE